MLSKDVKEYYAVPKNLEHLINRRNRLEVIVEELLKSITQTAIILAELRRKYE